MSTSPRRICARISKWKCFIPDCASSGRPGVASSGLTSLYSRVTFSSAVTLKQSLNDIQRTNGIGTVVHFARRIPTIADSVIDELKECFAGEETMTVEDRISPGDEVLLADGAFAGMRAFVLRVMPARRRIQVLLDVLGRPTPAEIDESSVVLERNAVADLVPVLAARRVGDFAVSG